MNTKYLQKYCQLNKVAACEFDRPSLGLIQKISKYQKTYAQHFLLFAYNALISFSISLISCSILRNQKRNLQNDQLKIDENFINLWGKVISIIVEVACEFDKTWQKRKRIIDSMLLIFLIFRLLFSKNSQGYGTTISDFWNNCHKMKFPLPQKRPVCASAFTQARSKLDETIFKILNKRIVSVYEDETNKLYRLNNQRIFSVDGSKINLPHELIENGYKTPSNNAYYPQGLVSCLYQLKSKIPYDFDLVKHGDERHCALSHLTSLKENDIVVYDRGYFSYAMLYYHMKAGAYPVFRLQKTLTKK